MKMRCLGNGLTRRNASCTRLQQCCKVRESRACRESTDDRVVGGADWSTVEHWRRPTACLQAEPLIRLWFADRQKIERSRTHAAGDQKTRSLAGCGRQWGSRRGVKSQNILNPGHEWEGAKDRLDECLAVRSAVGISWRKPTRVVRPAFYFSANSLYLLSFRYRVVRLIASILAALVMLRSEASRAWARACCSASCIESTGCPMLSRSV